jgi:hypothetical protein
MLTRLYKMSLNLKLWTNDNVEIHFEQKNHVNNIESTRHLDKKRMLSDDKF